MRQLFLAGLTAAFVSVGFLIKSSVPEAPLSAQAAPTILEGCLQSQGGAFTLRAGDTRYNLVGSGGIDFTPYVNHMVELTGTIERVASGRVFSVTALKMVSATCAPD
jgi:hypothetical protein